MAEPLYKKVIDANGNMSFVELPPSSTAHIATNVIQAAGDWIDARSAETSTKMGVIGGAVAAPAIADYASKAVIAGLMGDYVSTAMYGVPALLGIVSAIAAIVTPEHPKGPSDDDIHAAVMRMPRAELIRLLSGDQPIRMHSESGGQQPVPTAHSTTNG